MGRRAWALGCLLLAGCVQGMGSEFVRPLPQLPSQAGRSAVPASLPNGVASGDVDQSSAILWTRTLATGILTFTVGIDVNEPSQQILRTVIDPMSPVTVSVTGLMPDLVYRYRVENSVGESMMGRFKTPAEAGMHSGVRFGVSGDWRGDLGPYPAIANVPSRSLDLFVALGDTIYADSVSPAVPDRAAATLDEFYRKYAEVYGTHYGRNDWATLRASTPLLATIDDHEVTNDFAGGADAARDGRFTESSGTINDTSLYENALQAFLAYHPLRRETYGETGDPRTEGEHRLYRYRIYGADAAIFLLDARSFRDLPIARADFHDDVDIARFRRQTWRPERTLLGRVQLADLQRDLEDAQERGVTWKFVVSPVPMQYRGLLSAQDRFEGYAVERSELLRFITESSICNVVFVAADIHGTLVNELFYADGPDGAELPTPAIEVTVGSVAYYPPQGPVVVRHGVDAGLITAEEEAVYSALPVAVDVDSVADDKDDWVKAYFGRQLQVQGQDGLGLDGSPINATLLAGDYVAVHHFGWTEFAIDGNSQQLTVTTFGIAPYRQSDVSRDPEEIIAREPQIVSQFQVLPRQCLGR